MMHACAKHAGQAQERRHLLGMATQTKVYRHIEADLHGLIACKTLHPWYTVVASQALSVPPKMGACKISKNSNVK